jgi:hypothetical protein
VPSVVADTAEDRKVMIDNFPIRGNQNLNAPKNGVGFHNGLPAQHLSVSQVDFAGSENRRALRAMEILCRDAAFHAAEHRRFAFAYMIHQIHQGHYGDHDNREDGAGNPGPAGGGR